jgi:hypothetical protein
MLESSFAQAIRESPIYEAIVEQGRAEGYAKTLLLLGQKRFGAAPEDVQARLQAIRDLERLKRITDRLLDVASWQELLDTP